MSQNVIEAKITADPSDFIKKTDELPKIAEQANKEIQAVEKAALQEAKANTQERKDLFAELEAAGTKAFQSMYSQEAIRFAENISKVAQETGVGVEFLQKWTKANDVFGVGAQTSERMLANLKSSMQAATVEGSKEADVFKRLGISVKDANGQMKGTEQVLGEVSNALKGNYTALQRANVLQSIMGTEGKKASQLVGEGWDKATARLNAHGVMEKTKIEAITADAAQAKKRIEDLAQAQARADQQTAMSAERYRMRQTQANLGDNQVGLVGGLALGGIASLVTIETAKKIKQVTDEVANYAKEVGALSKALGVEEEFMLKWNKALAQNGVTTEQANKMLVTLSKNIGDAKEPTSQQAEMFRKLGISVMDVSGNMKSTQEVTVELSNKLSTMGSSAEQNAVLMKLMGESGAKASGLLKNGWDEASKALAEQSTITSTQLDILREYGQLTTSVFKTAKEEFAALIAGMVVGLVNIPNLIKTAFSSKGWKIDLPELTKEEKDAVMKDVKTFAEGLAKAHNDVMQKGQELTFNANEASQRREAASKAADKLLGVELQKKQPIEQLRENVRTATNAVRTLEIKPVNDEDKADFEKRLAEAGKRLIDARQALADAEAELVTRRADFKARVEREDADQKTDEDRKRRERQAEATREKIERERRQEAFEAQRKDAEKRLQDAKDANASDVRIAQLKKELSRLLEDETIYQTELRNKDKAREDELKREQSDKERRRQAREKEMRELGITSIAEVATPSVEASKLTGPLATMGMVDSAGNTSYSQNKAVLEELGYMRSSLRTIETLYTKGAQE